MPSPHLDNSSPPAPLCLLTLLVFLALLRPEAEVLAQDSNVRLGRSVVSAAAIAHGALRATVGQTMVGAAASQQYSVRLGFWTTIAPRVVSNDHTPMQPRVLHVDAYPNPIRERCTITVRLPAASTVEMDIVDISGRIVARQVHSEQTAGSVALHWLVGGSPGAPVHSGRYTAIIRATGYASGNVYHASIPLLVLH